MAAAAGVEGSGSSARVGVVLGTMEFVRPDRESESQAACEAQVASYVAAVEKSFSDSKAGAVLDTAVMYNQGASEKSIGQMKLAEGVEVHTKANPWGPDGLQPKSVRQQVEEWSMKNLQTGCIDLLYLHAPDHKTDIRETLAEVGALHKEGKFKRFGLSNYAAWQVAEIVLICREKGYPEPCVYQGMYNGLTRDVERELFPCLKRFNIAFYAYNPLAGGLLTGRITREAAAKPEEQGPGRFFDKTPWSNIYRDRFLTPGYFDGLELVQAAVKEAYPDGSVPLADAAIRWVVHHSGLDGERGDAIIVAGSRQSHLDANLASCAAGPLDQRVVDAFDKGWDAVRCAGSIPSYFR